MLRTKEIQDDIDRAAGIERASDRLQNKNMIR